MTYRIEFTPGARRDLKGLPRDAEPRVLACIAALAEDPFPPRSQKLEGGSGEYRVREGDYRIVYRVHADVVVIVIVLIAHRSDVYKRLRRR